MDFKEIASLAPVAVPAATALPSDPDDPHDWSVRTDPDEAGYSVFVRLQCGRCGTAIAASVARATLEESRDPDGFMRDFLLRAVRRGRVHPRCSEVRTVREVMES